MIQPPRLREKDLAHDADPVRFGAAMLKCEGYGPACSESGRCQIGGECFASPPNLVAARMIEGLLPTGPLGSPAGVHLAYLRKCAELLRAGSIHL